MSRRGTNAPVVLTADQHRQASARAWERMEDRYKALGRNIPPARDPKCVERHVTRRMVEEAAAVIDADPDLVEWVADKLNAANGKAGRPSELTVRTGLIVFWITTVLTKSFNLFEAMHLVPQLDYRDRRALGIDFLRDGEASQVSYDQLLELFHGMHEVFDAWDDTIPDTEAGYALREARAQDLQEFIDRLLACSTAAAPLWSGDAALDATMKWSWEHPPGWVYDKKPTTGKHADGDKAISYSEIVEEAGGLEAAGVVDEKPSETTRKAVKGRTKRKKSWPRSWSCGAMLVGRTNKAKCVYGYANHTITRAGLDEPRLVERLCVTPANAYARPVGEELLARVFEDRKNDPAVQEAVTAGRARFLGKIVADAAYSDSAPWPTKLRKMGASPVMRLNAKNQQNPEWIEIAPGEFVVSFMSSVFCRCVEHTGLLEERYPPFPAERADLEKHWEQHRKLDPYEWSPNGRPEPDGRRQLLRPHNVGPDGRAGGCEHCTHRDGTPVRGDDGRPRPRCCQKASRVFTVEMIPFYQDERFGDQPWYDNDWNPRNVAEGTYGVMKHPAVVGFGNDYHHFVGLAHETIAVAFAVCAYNYFMMRSWRALKALEETRDEEASRTAITVTLPPKRVQSEKPKHKKGPKGLGVLGQPRAGP